MKKTLALLALSLLAAGCEDWKIDMVGDHQSDDEYDHHHYDCSSCSTDREEEYVPPSQPAMLPSPSNGSTNEDAGSERTSQCVGSDSVCEYQITQAGCAAWAGCTWIPK